MFDGDAVTPPVALIGDAAKVTGGAPGIISPELEAMSDDLI